MLLPEGNKASPDKFELGHPLPQIRTLGPKYGQHLKVTANVTGTALGAPSLLNTWALDRTRRMCCEPTHSQDHPGSIGVGI
jgi:hypothetical protein